jgi:hypothetical protein
MKFFLRDYYSRQWKNLQDISCLLKENAAVKILWASMIYLC